MRTPIKAGITGVALVTAATLAVSVTSASGDDQSESSAYGLSIGGQAGQPSVEYKGGETQTGGGQIPAELGPLAAGGVLTVTAGDDQATAKVADLTLGSGLEQLPAELREGLQQLQQVCAGLPEDGVPTDEILGQVPGALKDVVNTPESLQEVCNALGGGDFTNLASIQALNTECNGDSGTVEVLKARAFNSDQALNDSDVDPNSSLLPTELAPLIEIVLNRQTPQGDSVTVDGLVLKLGGQEVAVLASATCGGPIAHDPVGNDSTPAPAPAPTPVPAHVPVTG